jgi:ABC-type phosphate transport system auxiliary subunit
MPSPVTYWLQQIVMAIVLIGTIVLLVTFPARHVLMPLWPAAVDEYILAAEGERAERVLLRSSAEQRPPGQSVTASSRPLSVVALQAVNEGPSFGFLAGYRLESGGPLVPVLPEALRAAIVELPLHPDWVLVMLSADDQLLELPAASLVAVYRPNQLSLPERFGLLLSRVATGLRRA